MSDDCHHHHHHPPLSERIGSCFSSWMVIILILALIVAHQLYHYGGDPAYCDRAFGLFDFSCPVGTTCGGIGVCRPIFSPLFDFLSGN